MSSQSFLIKTNSHILIVNGAIIVNTLGKTAFCLLLEGESASIYLLILVNRHTPPFPVELSKRTYEMLTTSFTHYIKQ